MSQIDAQVDSTNTTSTKPFAKQSNVQFVCNQCLTSNFPTTQPQNNDSSSTPYTNNTAVDIINEVSKMRAEISSLQSVANEMNGKMESIETTTKVIAVNTEITLKKIDATKQSTENQPFTFGERTPQSPAYRFRPQLNHGNLRSSGLKLDAINGTPKAKRPRDDTPNQQQKKQKPNVPVPVMGTKASTSGLVVVAVPETKIRAEKPKFTKAVWISRLGPTTTEEMVREYITQNTSVSNCSVHKLVKKDRDLSTLNFISFKIAVNETDFGILNDKEVWPANVMVREFVEVKPTSFGDFLPTNMGASGPSATGNTQSYAHSETMDLTAESPTKITK